MGDNNEAFYLGQRNWALGTANALASDLQASNEKLAAHVAVKNAALVALKKLDPKHYLLVEANRKRIGDDARIRFRKTGKVDDTDEALK